ncbi:MAG: Rne/Rng family ribonuclease [Andreesenia angusta]|nr:Rne/Rng family ribonuclease [Andreesenia angusta]
MNKIVVDSNIRENRIAVLEDDELVDIYLDRIDDERIRGNIYLGKVVNVLQGMQAAFIDIGLKKNAFLHLRDALPRYIVESDEFNISDYNIRDVLKPGQDILVQVDKEAFNSKGAKVTTQLSITGKYAAIIDNTKYIYVSKKIVDKNKRKRVKNIAKKCLPEGIGIILRTISEDETEDNIILDINYLVNKLEKIKTKARIAKAPELISRLDIVQKIVKDYLKDDIDEIIVNDREVYEELLKIFKNISEDNIEKLKFFDKSHDIFGYLGIEKMIEEAIQKEVKLDCGASIVIDETEALTVIDVNSGKFIGKNSLEETVLKVNKEASREIAKQLRLRNIGGIIIIDFIDMKRRQDIEEILNILKEELKKDVNKTTVLGMTKLGLVEMTRKKTIGRLTTRMLKKCPVCGGRGRVDSEYTVIHKLQNEAKRVFKNTSAKSIAIEVNSTIIDYIDENYLDFYDEIKKYYDLEMILKGNNNIDYGDIKILRMGSKSFVNNYLKSIE